MSQLTWDLAYQTDSVIFNWRLGYNQAKHYNDAAVLLVKPQLTCSKITGPWCSPTWWTLIDIVAAPKLVCLKWSWHHLMSYKYTIHVTTYICTQIHINCILVYRGCDLVCEHTMSLQQIIRNLLHVVLDWW